MTTPIKSLIDDELIQWLKQNGQPAFRLKQIHDWLYRHWVVTFDEMTNLSATLRQKLADDFYAFSLTEETRQAADDGTVKFLFRLRDGESIETVLIPSAKRRTVCISTQVGCPVRCAFCASGKGGLVRNLNRGEIIDQVIQACRHTGESVTNIVVMGMGEPMLNPGELLPALQTICSPDQFGLGSRHITVSTSGIPAGIKQLADEQRPWNLALSLHATTDEARARLIPPQHRFPIAEILAACQYYRQKTNRMVTLEYALLAGSNDSMQQAEELAQIARSLRAKVNLIPCNSSSSAHHAPDEKNVRRFHNHLIKRGVQASVRQRRGDQIQAACGQLKSQTQPPRE